MNAIDSESQKLEAQLRGLLDEMNSAIFARDLAVVDRFWTGGKFWLFGSEAHENDMTRADLQRHMQHMFAEPYRVRFAFDQISFDHHGDMAWLNAPATLEIHHPDRVAKMPYRLFALFQNIAGVWHWRVFSGSEPAAPPTP